jgi:hypothetical protein
MDPAANNSSLASTALDTVQKMIDESSALRQELGQTTAETKRLLEQVHQSQTECDRLVSEEQQLVRSPLAFDIESDTEKGYLTVSTLLFI